MSAPLYSVTVLEVGHEHVALDLVSVCEAGCFTATPLFGVGLLYEPLEGSVSLRPGLPWPRRIDGPLRALFTEEELADWGGSGVPASEASRLAIVRDVAYGPFRNVPPLAVGPDPDGLRRRGLRRGVDPEFLGAAQAFHRGVAPAYARSDGARRGLLPAATVRITVAAAQWTGHLAPGMIWDGYSFDDEGGMIL